MIRFINKQFAINTLLVIFSMIIIFHVLVVIGVVPFNMIWGGRLTTHEQMIQFEMVSILINVLMISVVAIYGGYLSIHIKPMIIKVALWIMFVLFFLNTIGNLFSISEWEKIIFTPITFLLAIFSLRLAMD
jgi:hypothetical protein